MKLTRLIWTLALIVSAGSASAQVQKCTDSTGKVSYSDVPCPQAVSKKQSLGIPSISNNYEAAAPRVSLSRANDGFNERHAQRAQDALAEQRAVNNKALIEVLKTPLEPGQSRTVTYVPK